MVKLEKLFSENREKLKLTLVTGAKGLTKRVKVPEIYRPGLSLAGYLHSYSPRRILIFGRVETEYLRELDLITRQSRLEGILGDKVPAVIVTRRFKPPKELIQLCTTFDIPLFRSALPTMALQSQLTVIMAEEFSPSVSCHGTLVEAFGVGVLIQGDSSVGKSETALGLIERGHRLISDDVVKVKKKEGSYLEGTGPELTRHLLEIRGIGIINVAHLFGAVCISEEKRIDIIVKLEEWDDDHFYDRVGLEEKKIDILGLKVPYHLLPVKPGRDVVLLLETIVLNYRLKQMGYNSAKEFNIKLLDAIAKRQKRKPAPLLLKAIHET
ncbi:MAG: HPr(Ser) kinase/phosphatase [Simkaniaceae bacterium]